MARGWDELQTAPSGRDKRADSRLFNLQFASDAATVPRMAKARRRSACPVAVSLDQFGDRWSLLIIRDLMVRGCRSFKDFQRSGEKIASNVLADRLKKLEAAGILEAEPDEADARRVNYRLTEKGIDLAPVLLELLIWGAQHEDTIAPGPVIEKMAANRAELLALVRKRWRERDRTPVLPWFKVDTNDTSPRRRKR